MIHIVILHSLYKDNLLQNIMTYYFGGFKIATQFALIRSPGHTYVLITNVINTYELGKIYFIYYKYVSK